MTFDLGKLANSCAVVHFLTKKAKSTDLPKNVTHLAQDFFEDLGYLI